MQHLENIDKMFGKSFVENPLIESFDAGKIEFTSGHLVACDPLITNDMQPFSTNFPIGSHKVLVHKEKDSNCIAYAEIQFSEKSVAEWMLATTEGQKVSDLAEGEVFGYPVESGMGCFMDVETQDLLNKLEQLLFERKGDDFMGIYQEFFHHHFFDTDGAIDQYALLKPHEQKMNNIFAFETGYGEGFYASYIGFDLNKNPVKIITEFIEIGN